MGEIMKGIMKNAIRLENLCETSPGIQMFMNAQELERERRPEALVLFLMATNRLELEIERAPKGSPERKEVLRMLSIAYRKLAVESGLPDEYQKVKFRTPCFYYTHLYASVEEELKRYS